MTTESEPRRLGRQNDRTRWIELAPRHGSMESLRARGWEIVEVVGSGHDEQTRCATCKKAVTTGEYVNASHGLVWHTACGDPPYDERTVAAVVEALWAVLPEGHWRNVAIQRIERFKPSASESS